MSFDWLWNLLPILLFLLAGLLFVGLISALLSWLTRGFRAVPSLVRNLVDNDESRFKQRLGEITKDLKDHSAGDLRAIEELYRLQESHIRAASGNLAAALVLLVASIGFVVAAGHFVDNDARKVASYDTIKQDLASAQREAGMIENNIISYIHEAGKRAEAGNQADDDADGSKNQLRNLQYITSLQKAHADAAKALIEVDSQQVNNTNRAVSLLLFRISVLAVSIFTVLLLLRAYRTNTTMGNVFRGRMIELLASDRDIENLSLRVTTLSAEPKIDVEVNVASEQLDAMLRHVESTWALLGEREPHWSVLSYDNYKPDNIETQLESFYASGKKSVSYFTHAVERAGLDYRNLSTCIEFGCGVGRLSVWLAEMFPRVVGLDISKPHICLAQKAREQFGKNNVEFRHTNTLRDITDLEPYDCFISVIVFQHNPPPVIAALLSTFLSKLAPGGLAYFQLPTYRKGIAFRADEYLKSLAGDGTMEMHVLPQAVLWQIAEAANCQLADIREDDWVGHPDFISNSVLLRKRP